MPRINPRARAAESSFLTILPRSASRLICGRKFKNISVPLHHPFLGSGWWRGNSGKSMTTLSSKTITYEQLAKVIDHSLLRPELTEADVIAGCELAARYHVATVCVKPCDVKLAKELLKESDVLVSTVVGFPHGSNLTAIKVAEAEKAMDEGARELDMVLNIGQLRSGKHDFVREDIKAVCEVSHAGGVKV